MEITIVVLYVVGALLMWCYEYIMEENGWWYDPAWIAPFPLLAWPLATLLLAYGTLREKLDDGNEEGE